MNSVQKNFTKQMKKSLKKMKKENKDMYYNYLRKNHLHNPELDEQGLSFPRRVLRILGKVVKLTFAFGLLILVIVIGYAIMDSNNSKDKNAFLNNISPSTEVVSNINNTSQQSIVNYINAIRAFENNISSDINLRNNDLASYNNKLITTKECLNNLIVYKNRIDKNIQEMTKVNCPKELIEYKSELDNTYRKLSTGIDFEIKYYQTNKANDLKQSKDYTKAFNEGKANSNKLLNSTLDQFNIKHN
jgi:hypothetical protein